MKTLSSLILVLAISTFFLATAAAQPSQGTSTLLEGPGAGVDSPGPACISEPAGLVGWWRGEGEGSDSAGTNNAYSLTGVAFTNGVVGQAFSFNPTNGTVAVKDSAGLRLTNQLTIEAWINMRTYSDSGGSAVIGKLSYATGNYGYQLVVVSNTVQGLFNSPGTGWPSQRIISGPVLSTGVWQHVAFTYDQSSLVLYCNGQALTNRVIGAQTIATSASDLSISSADAHGYFDGLVDEASVYNRALSAAEIAAIYNAGISGKCFIVPVIISQPVGQTVLRGDSVSLTVTATGDPAPSYQWQFGGANLSGATGSALMLSNVSLADAGNYSVAVSNRAGVVGSEVAALTVVTETLLPGTLAVCDGSPAVFATGISEGSLAYQWQVSQDGGLTFTNISNTATNASYTNLNATVADSGNLYQVIVIGSVSSLTSAPPALLRVYTASGTVSTAGDQTICSADSTARLGGVIGGGEELGLWTSSGSGVFLPDATTLNATYAPSAADIAAGPVTLTLTAEPCADTNTQVVVTINLTPPAPSVQDTAICGAGVASLSASGTGGTLNWYSDATLTNLVNTGPAYTPTVSGTTTYYVTETSSRGCQSVPSTVMVSVYTSLSTANAGTNQVLSSLASTVQLAGSVSNASGATWSGGSGTFSPNARALNAVYTPSATEIAAGSWALTLTADANPCGVSATSTMTFSYRTQVGLPLNTGTSSLKLTVCLEPKTGTTDLGMQCQAGTNRLMGDILLEFDDPIHPTSIALQDFHFTAMAPYHLSFKWTSPATIPMSVTIGTLEQPVTVSNTYAQTATVSPINPTTGAFTLTNVPFSSGGAMAYYSGTMAGSIDLSPQTNATVTGTVLVTNEVATVHLSFSALGTCYAPATSESPTITGYTTFEGSIDAEGATAPPRYMVWNNGAGTSNWNTTDANWNNGSARWDNGRALDGAVFAGAGVGIVNLTQPMTASSIWFSSPGYTLGGSSLNLLNECAITNDADAVISGPIASGGLSKWGSGTLRLSGENTYTGATTIGAGMLQYANPAALGTTSKITVENGAEVFFDSGLAGATVSQPIELSGVGVNGGALHTFVPGGQITFSGEISLLGNSQIYAQAANSSLLTFSAPISGSHDVTLFAGGDGGDQVSFGLGAASTYTGATYIDNNNSSTLVILNGGNNRLPTGTTVYMSSGAGSAANSSTLDLNGNSQTLASLQDGPVVAGPRRVRNSSGTASMLTLSNAFFSGTLEGNLGLTKAGSGTVSLSSANTYSGNTVIQAGTLGLSGFGTLGSASTSVSLAAGATLDVSAVTGAYFGLGSATLRANGTASPATINGALAGAVDLGSQPIILTHDGTHPPLTIAQGTLSLGGNAITVDKPVPLPVGDYVLIQQANGDIASTGTFPVAAGTAIGTGYRGDISVVGGQVILSVVLTALPSTTTLGPVPSPQTYGNVTLSATVSPSAASGTVTFMDGMTVLGTRPLGSGTATFTPVASQLQVPGSPYAIRAVYSGDASYAASSSSISNLAVLARALQVTGSTTYDGTELVAAERLRAMNNIDGENLTIGGTAVMGGKSAGSQNVVSSTYRAPSRVQTTTAATGTSAATTLAATLSGAPANGNTLVAVISTRATTANTVTSITQAGASWRRAVQATGTSGTIEIWYAPNVANTSSSLTIHFASTILAAAIMEYSGVFTVPALDQTASATGSGTAAATGTTPATTQANELCVAGIGLVISENYLLSPLNGFTKVASCLSGSTTATWVFALEKVVSSTGAQGSGGTVNLSSAWTGAIATFVGVPSLTLSGSMAPNYTVAGVSGSVSVNPLPITLTAASLAKVYDATVNSLGVPTITLPLVGGDTATLSQTFGLKTVGTETLTPTATITDGNGGGNYAVTPTTATAAITAKALTVSGLAANSKVYDDTTAATLSGGALQTAEAPGSGTSADGKPYTGDSVALSGTASGVFADANVGSGKAVTVSGFSTAGGDAVNYAVSSPTGVTAAITQRPVALAGSMTYNGNTAIPAGNLAIANNLDGTALTLSGTSATLASRNAGTGSLVSSAFSKPVRIQQRTGSTGTATGGATSFPVTITAPAAGNTLIAVVSTRSVTADAVNDISGGGATWTILDSSPGTAGSTTEIWYAPNVSGGGTTVTISMSASVRAAAVVMEYSGLLTAEALDVSASTSGVGTAASTGTTETTAQPNELWLGAIGLLSSSYTLTVGGSPAFTSVANAASSGTTATLNAKVYALEYVASATGAASSGGTLSTSSKWSGAMATFKCPGTLILAGSAAGNYTAVGATSAVTVSPTNLTVTAAYNSKLYDGTVTAAAMPTITSGSIQVGDSAPAWTERYANPNVGTGKTLAPVAAVVSDGNGGANYSVTYATTAGDITALQIAPGGQPTNTTECAGSPAVFSASAPAMCAYQWQVSKDGGVTFTNISDTATNASYTEPSPTVADNGSQYQVVVSAGGGSVTSAPPALLTIHLCSGAHSIQSVVNNRDGTFTLNMLGTPGAQYYLVSSPNPEAPLSDWAPVAGSTNTASSPGGTWSCVVSDPSPAHFRVVAVHPGP